MKRLRLSVGPADVGDRLDRFLARAGDISRGEARRVLERGGVWVDGKRVKGASRAMRLNQEVLLVLEETAARRAAPAASLERARILFEDAHLVAVDKPPFVASQPTLGSDSGDLLALTKALVAGRLWLVHRLDLETSGVTLFAKSRAAVGALTKAFRERAVSKRYLALVADAGALADEGDIDLSLSADASRPGRQKVNRHSGAQAFTHYRVCSRGMADTALVEALPQTGRTHQIRVHFAALGAPLLGDKLYGGPTSRALDGDDLLAIPRVMLHAASLSLSHPVRDEALHIEAPLPADMVALARRLAIDTPA